jgi:acyl carrier protein
VATTLQERIGSSVPLGRKWVSRRGSEAASRIEKELRAFIAENFPVGQDGGELTNKDSFLDSGLIDSTGILELVTFLEETFEIEVLDEEMLPENLDTIDNVVAYLGRKKS